MSEQKDPVLIAIKRSQIMEAWKSHLDREPTELELKNFLEYMKDDIDEWLYENGVEPFCEKEEIEE